MLVEIQIIIKFNDQMQSTKYISFDHFEGNSSNILVEDDIQEILDFQIEKPQKQKLKNQAKNQILNILSSHPLQSEAIKTLTPEPQNQLIQDVNHSYKWEYFSGKLFSPWFFLIEEQGVYHKINTIYNHSQQTINNHIVFSKNLEESKQYFKAENSCFRVVADLKNAKQLLLNPQLFNHLEQIYLYLNSNESLKQEAQLINKFKQKLGYKKVTLINSIDVFIEKLKIEHSRLGQLVESIQRTLKQKHQLNPSPSFIDFNQTLSLQTTKFRRNLWTSVKLFLLSGKLNLYTQIKQFLDQFRKSFQRFYHNQTPELNLLKQYLEQITHSYSHPDKQSNLIKTLFFFQQNSPLSKFMNSILNIYRKIPNFKPTVLPFAETYTAIKYLNDKKNQSANYIRPQLKFYLGIGIEDVQNFKAGTCWQCLGFLYASKDQQKTLKWVRQNKGCLLVITVPQVVMNQSDRMFDPGFIDYDEISKRQEFQILMKSDSFKQFQKEQNEIMINAFNLFRVTNVQITNQDNSQSPKVPRIELELTQITYLQKQANESETDFYSQEQNPGFRIWRWEIERQFDEGDFFQFIQEQDKEFQYRKSQVLIDRSFKNKIKLLEIQPNAQNYQQMYETVKQLSLECIQLSDSDSVSFKYTSDQREKVKKLLKQYEDGVNLQQVLQQQVAVQRQLINHSQKNQSKQLQSQIQLTKLLQQLGKSLLSNGDYIRAKVTFKQNANILEEVLTQIQELIKKYQHDNKKSFFSPILNLFSSNKNEQDGCSRQQKQRRRQKLESKYKDCLKITIQNVNSLLSCYRYLTDDKQRQTQTEKGKTIIQRLKQLEKGKSINLKEESSLAQIETIFYLNSNGTNKIEQIEEYQQSKETLGKLIQKLQKEDPSSMLIAKMCSLKAQLNKNQLQNSLILPSSLFQLPQNQNSQTQSYIQQKHTTPTRFNYQLYTQILNKSAQIYQKSIQIQIINLTQNHPEVFKTRNNLAELFFENQKYHQAQTQSIHVCDSPLTQFHTQGSKAQLLLGKISLARGLYKNAFESLSKASNILTKAIVKEKTIPYEKNLKNSQIYRDIELMRVKIYRKQKKHDLSLKTLNSLQSDSNTEFQCMADVYVEMASTIALRKNPGDQSKYISLFEQAIKIRQKNGSKINLENAICYCSIAKFLISSKQVKKAEYYLKKGEDIFSHFPSDHPNRWIPYLTRAQLIQKGQELNQDRKKINESQYERSKPRYFSLELMKKSVDLAKIFLGQKHINFAKAKLQYAWTLKKHRPHASQSLNEFKQLLQILNVMSQLESRAESEYHLYIESEVEILKKIVSLELDLNQKQNVLKEEEQKEIKDKPMDSNASLNEEQPSSQSVISSNFEKKGFQYSPKAKDVLNSIQEIEDSITNDRIYQMISNRQEKGAKLSPLNSRYQYKYQNLNQSSSKLGETSHQ